MTETQTLTLADFLLARIAEDEADCREDAPHHHSCDPIDSGRCDCGLPARVLAECEAKRRIVGLWDLRLSDNGDPLGGLGAEVYYDAIKALALPYADHHADFRTEWKP